MSLKDFFDGFEDCCNPTGEVSFKWSARGAGFGNLYFYFNEKDSYVHCENELMGREFIKKMLCNMVDNCVLDCPGEWDEATNGNPPGYNPKPYVQPELPAVKRIKRDDKDSPQG